MTNKKIIDLDLPSLPLNGTELIEMSVGGSQSIKVTVSEALVCLYNSSNTVLETTPNGIKSTKTQFIIGDNSDNDVVVIDDAGDVQINAGAGLFGAKFTKIIGKTTFVRVIFSHLTNGIQIGDAGYGPPAHAIDFLGGGYIRGSGLDLIRIGLDQRWVFVQNKFYMGAGTSFTSGLGSPEGIVEASNGSIYLRRDGGSGTTFYVKEGGFGITGWVAK